MTRTEAPASPANLSFEAFCVSVRALPVDGAGPDLTVMMSVFCRA
jgi:hypothetical protein